MRFKSISRARVFSAAFSIACSVQFTLAAALPLAAQSSHESQDVHLRNDCRLAAQTLTKGHPAPKTDWALSIIHLCDETGGAALQALWAEPTSDSVALEQLVAASSRLLDQHVFLGVMAEARNVGAARSARLAALRVLAAFISNTTLIDPDDLAKPKPDTIAIRQFSTISGGLVQTVGSQPLSATALGDIRALFATLAQTDADPTVKGACRYLRVWFSNH